MTYELTETLENYLESIYTIIMNKNGVRVKDIARGMGVKSSTVTVALRSLEKNGYINYEPYGIISLTRKGNLRARQLTERHRFIKKFLMKILGIDGRRAEEASCSIEHALDQETFHRFVQFVRYIYHLNGDDPAWIEEFKKFCADNEIPFSQDGSFPDEYLKDF